MLNCLFLGSISMFVKNKVGNLRLCIDYRQLNKVIVRYKYPLSKIDDLSDQLRKAMIFSKINLRSYYHQVWIKDDDISKKTFIPRCKYFEFVMVPFGLRNGPTTFICLMNGMFYHYMKMFTVFFLDDIMINSKS